MRHLTTPPSSCLVPWVVCVQWPAVAVMVHSTPIQLPLSYPAYSVALDALAVSVVVTLAYEPYVFRVEEKRSIAPVRFQVVNHCGARISPSALNENSAHLAFAAVARYRLHPQAFPCLRPVEGRICS